MGEEAFRMIKFYVKPATAENTASSKGGEGKVPSDASSKRRINLTHIGERCRHLRDGTERRDTRK